MMKEKYQRMYLENFVYLEERGNDKKFLKFCDKMIENMFVVIQKVFPTMNNVFVSDYEKKDYKNLLNFVTNYIFVMHYSDLTLKNDFLDRKACPITKDNRFHKGKISNYAVKYLTIPPLLVRKEFRDVHKQVILSANQSPCYNNLEWIFYECCVNAIRKYVSNYSLIYNVEINNIIDLYEHCVPKNDFVYMEIIREIINTYNQFLMDVSVGTYLRDMGTLDVREFQDMEKTTIEESIKQISESNKKIARLEEENAKLKEHLQKEIVARGNIEKKMATTTSQKTNEEIQKENFELVRKNAKLEQQLLELSEKYNEVKNKTPILQKSDRITTKNIEECDINKKYGFVVGENLALQNKILSKFPNSIILAEGVKSFDVDCVVFITECLGHSLYYKVKGMCDSQNIPYIHCNFKNVECIKSTIAKVNVA